MIPETLPATFFETNRKELLSQLPANSIAIFNANDQMPRNGDLFYPFRQNSDLFYLTGIQQEETCLILHNSARGEETALLFIMHADKTRMIWEGIKLDRESAASMSGINQVNYLDNLFDHLDNIIGDNTLIFLNSNENQRFDSPIEYRDLRFAKKIRERYPDHEIRKAAPYLEKMRLIKKPEEIRMIKKAAEITGKAFNRVLKIVTPGMMEYEIEAELTYEFIKNGRLTHAYDPIIASGGNACILHYTENKDQCQEGELLMMDFGAEYNNYASDCSRTIPVSGQFTPRQRELYQATLDVFEQIKDETRPGVTIKQLQSKAVKLWKEKHIGLGLYTKKEMEEEDPQKPLYFNYFMHGVSHYMGLDVHDPGAKDKPLQPGAVITCEPGIYIEKEKVGIRLENDLLITADGCEDLMSDIPMHPDEIEKLMINR